MSEHRGEDSRIRGARGGEEKLELHSHDLPVSLFFSVGLCLWSQMCKGYKLLSLLKVIQKSIQ